MKCVRVHACVTCADVGVSVLNEESEEKFPSAYNSMVKKKKKKKKHVASVTSVISLMLTV